MLIRLVIKEENRETLYQRLVKQTPEEGLRWKGLEFTTNPVEECDMLIVFNFPPVDLKVRCREGGCWLISREPPIPPFRWYKRSFPHFDRVFSQFKGVKGTSHILTHGSEPWQVQQDYAFLKALKPESENKQNKASFLTSNLAWTSGHRYRMKLVEAIQKEQPPEVELFGRGIRFVEDKFSALYPFKYSLIIENSSYPHYWTEKIADAFLSWNLPLYWGASNISEYFPRGAYIPLDPRKPERALDQLRSVIRNNEWEDRLDDLRRARELVLEEYQFFPRTEQLIREYLPTSVDKKTYHIPANLSPWKGGKESFPRKLEYHLRKWLSLHPH